MKGKDIWWLRFSFMGGDSPHWSVMWGCMWWGNMSFSHNLCGQKLSMGSIGWVGWVSAVMTSRSLFLGTVPNRDFFQLKPKKWSLFCQFSPYSVHLVPIYQIWPEKNIECYTFIIIMGRYMKYYMQAIDVLHIVMVPICWKTGLYLVHIFWKTVPIWSLLGTSQNKD